MPRRPPSLLGVSRLTVHDLMNYHGIRGKRNVHGQLIWNKWRQRRGLSIFRQAFTILVHSG
jgi:hypothetical protein